MNLAEYKLVLPKPYSTANYSYVMASLKQRGLTKAVCSMDNVELSVEHIAIGSSNLITLFTAGRSMLEISGQESARVGDYLGKVMWKTFDGAFIWESAAALEPESLARFIKKSGLLPRVNLELLGAQAIEYLQLKKLR